MGWFLGGIIRESGRSSISRDLTIQITRAGYWMPRFRGP
jgi:hypothetical protein